MWPNDVIGLIVHGLWVPYIPQKFQCHLLKYKQSR